MSHTLSHALPIYLLPYMGVGGVELAAQQLLSAKAKSRIRLETIYSDTAIAEQGLAQTFNPLAIVASALRIAALKPPVLVVSLWRAYLVGILVKCLRPSTRLVTFLHNTRDEHVLDAIATRLCVLMSHAVWGDCEGSLKQRTRFANGKKQTVISFLLQRWPASSTLVAPKFIFWGRLASQKNIARAIGIFEKVHRALPHATFTIAGPDSGCLNELKTQVQKVGLNDAVDFIGPIDHSQLTELAQQHSIFLQTSDYEGMAVAVVEAMQLGLLPVVTPVGEIANYCTHSQSAVFVNQDDMAALAIIDIVEDKAQFERLRAAAQQVWRNKPLYEEDFLTALRHAEQGS